MATTPVAYSGWRTVVSPTTDGHLDVVEADHREVLRHPQPELERRLEDADRLHVGGREDGGRRVLADQQVARERAASLAAVRPERLVDAGVARRLDEARPAMLAGGEAERRCAGESPTKARWRWPRASRCSPASAPALHVVDRDVRAARDA